MPSIPGSGTVVPPEVDEVVMPPEVDDVDDVVEDVDDVDDVEEVDDDDPPHIAAPVGSPQLQ